MILNILHIFFLFILLSYYFELYIYIYLHFLIFLPSNYLHSTYSLLMAMVVYNQKIDK